MKYIYLTFLLALFITARANRSPILFQQLSSINACWNEQTDIRHLPLYGTAKTVHTDTQLIRLHLTLVESVLRNRNTEGLSEEQKTARLRNLDHLNQYRQINTYPVNNKTLARNPVFIDDHNTFCAVGYLIKMSGHELLARRIAATQNLDYLRDIRMEGLTEWVLSSGLTLDELAWIQPAYMAGNDSRSLGKGVNGTVYAMAGNEQDNVLYAAGNFTLADEQVACNNIVAVNYDPQSIFTNTFTALGAGLNGTVRALYMDNATLYAGGEFSASGTTLLHNIAKWDGTKWEAMGELNGTVRCIEKFYDVIYAGGAFTYSYNGKTYQNLAFWDGSNWRPITEHPIGKVNALKNILNVRLVVGGEFTAIDTLVVNHIFSYANPEITPMANGVRATVRTIDWDGKACVAAGDMINQQTDSVFGYAYFNSLDNIWEYQYEERRHLHDSDYVINAYSEGYIAGKFTSQSMYYSVNTGKIGYQQGLGSFATTNGEVFSIVKLGKRVFFGGNFSGLQSAAFPYVNTTFQPANNIATWDPDYVGLNNITSANAYFTISPNPTSGTTRVASTGTLKTVSIYDLNGQLIWKNTPGTLLKEMIVERNIFTRAGLYFVSVETTEGHVQNQKLLVD